MAEVVDFFFSPYQTALERRRRAALHDGLWHGANLDPRDPAPGEPVTLLLASNANRSIERVAVYYTTDGTDPAGERGVSTTSSVVIAEYVGEAVDALTEIPVRRWRAVIPGQPDGTLVRYRADGWSEGDIQAHWYADNADPVSAPPERGRIFAYSVDRLRPPSWFRNAIIYQIFVDRFAAAPDEPPMRDPGSITGYFGGTLGGVLDKLDYIQSLNVDCIWLSPVSASPTAHGYNPSDYYQVAERYGGNRMLRRLIDAAHQRGLRVVLDFVANHTSDEHPLFQAAHVDSASPAASWYIFDMELPNGYRSYAQVSNMPELVTDHPEVQRYLTDAALYWLSGYGADGLRLDYVPGPSHAFWTIFQRELRQRFPQALTLGEITEPLEGIATYAGRMDAYMDFPLAGVLRRVFASRTASLRELLAYLDERAAQLPPEMARATLLDNHDMHRFLWLAGGDKRRLTLAATCLLTLDGTPALYYGSEVGMTQAGDAQKETALARAPMVWDETQDQTLLAHFRHLTALRRAHPALRVGTRKTLPTHLLGTDATSSEQVGAYARSVDGNSFVVVLNNEEHPVTVRVPLGQELAAGGATLASRSLLRNFLAPQDGYVVEVIDGAAILTLPALGAAVLGVA